MSYLWNPSTTVRNSRRIINFLLTAREIEGREWTHDTMIEYQARLIMHRYYNPNRYHPLMNNAVLSLDNALEIFHYQNYVDEPMRGRNSLSPLRKLGLVSIDRDNIVRLTQLGNNILENPNNFDTTQSMILWTFEDEANIRPFVATVRFIYELDQLCNNHNGVSYSEFGHYIMTLSYYTEISSTVQYLIDVRSGNQMPFTYEDLSRRFTNFNNYDDYLDNNIRYLRDSSIIDISNGRIQLNYENSDIINYIIDN